MELFVDAGKNGAISVYCWMFSEVRRAPPILNLDRENSRTSRIEWLPKIPSVFVDM